MSRRPAPPHIARETLFGVPAHVLARWCQVSPRTARAWLAGSRRPGPSAAALIRLYLAGRVLEPGYWPGVAVRDERLYLVDDGLHVTRRELDQLAPILALYARRLACLTPPELYRFSAPPHWPQWLQQLEARIQRSRNRRRRER